ncbi:MAG: GHKL domain-containing protein, partial [Ruminiclostridium sp.]|nr:GHKL domain-containing protein [Ruminiclostridium sp.]
MSEPTMYELTSYIALFLRYSANVIFGFFFLSKLLTPKCGKGKGLLLLGLMYMPFQTDIYFAFNRVNCIEDILSIVLDIGFLLLVQRLLFKGSFGMELFAALSIAAGKDLLGLIIGILDYRLLGELDDKLLTYLVNEHLDIFINWGAAISFLSFVILSAIAVTSYVLLLRLYLRLISKGLGEKGKVMAASETAFLILPPAAALCIRVVLQIMNVDELNDDYYSSIYDRYPATKLLIPLSAFLLLTAIIVSAVLFGRLMRYNDEKLKRRLLEAQVSGMEKEISEIKDIYSDIRGLRHDMHNHIANISLYVRGKSGEDETLSEYLGQMRKTVDRLDFSCNTGNPITDIIIRRRAQEAEKKNISFKSDFAFPKNLGIDAFDIGVILDNALENCITACEDMEG